MRLKFNIKYIVPFIVLILIVIIFIFILSNKKNKSDTADLSSLKKALGNVFYTLPNDEYKNMNDISDYCKISLIYGSDYLESDSKYNNTKAYSISNVSSSIKKILGINATIDFKPDDNGDYKFLKEDNCVFGNNYVSNLSFDSEKQVLYTLKPFKTNRKIYIKWEDEVKDGNDITLYAKALMGVEAEDGYDLYSDFNMEKLIGHYDSKNKLEKSLDSNYILSNNYEFHLRKEKGNYIWKSFTKNNMDTIIVD